MRSEMSTQRRLSICCLAISLCTSGLLAQSQEELAGKIDGYLAARKTQTRPLSSLGTEFVARGGEYGIEPRLIVAIAGAESSFGAHICSHANAWNWFWNRTCENSPFDSWQSGIKTLSKFMRKSYLLKGYNTIPLIGAKYCAEGCEHWVPNVTQFYLDLGGNTTTLAYVPGANPVIAAGSSSATYASPVVTPVASPPRGKAIRINARVVNATDMTHSWLSRKPHQKQVEVEAVIGPAEPLAKSVKLVRVLPQGVEELAILRQEGRDENDAYVFSGVGTFETANEKSVELQVIAAFAKPKGKTAASNVVSVTVVPKPSHGGLIAVIAVGSVLLLGLAAMGVFLVARSRKTKLALRKAA